MATAGVDVDAMDFVPMISIEKKAAERDTLCKDWVATEKIHGSSFQFYTSDGNLVNVGSRRKALDRKGSFLKCSMKNLLTTYQEKVQKVWQTVKTEDKWEPYRHPFEGYNDDDDEDDEDDAEEKEEQEEYIEQNGATTNEQLDIRVYGELYGGGGVNKPDKSAVQKEIVYCDDFRFYVFGMTINNKWVTISELNALCTETGFPYFARAVCEPQDSMEALKEFLTSTGFMKSKSAYTDKTDLAKARIEGVVMTPLIRPDFRLHAVKFLSPSFNDVREEQNGQARMADFCTKQRYHSVISKLDTEERLNTSMVVDMFVADIIKESPDKTPHDKQKEQWSRSVVNWLKEDGYVAGGKTGKQETQPEEEEEVDMAGLFG